MAAKSADEALIAIPANLRAPFCMDGVSAAANAAWLSGRMIGSGAPRGRKTANQFKIRKPLLMSTDQIWQGRVCYRPRGCDFVLVPFFEGETDGSETN